MTMTSATASAQVTGRDGYLALIRDVAGTVQVCNDSLDSRPLSEVDSSLDVLSLARDLATLVHSYATKLSIAAKPPKTPEAVDACLKELAKASPAFGALCHNAHRDVQGIATSRFIGRNSKYILAGLIDLVTAVFEDEPSPVRLAQTGILYESCDDLKGIVPDFQLVIRKVKEANAMIGDAVEDLQSWLDGDDDDDDFGLGDSEDDGDDDDDEDGLTSAASGLSLGKQRSEAEIIETRRRITMLERVRMLLKALATRLVSADMPLVTRNAVFTCTEQLVVDVDELAGEVQDTVPGPRNGPGGADEAYLMELEKAVVHRVEDLLTALVTTTVADDKARTWVDNFRARWREPTSSASQIPAK
ncbi:hypothetical protein PYCC9005_004326 [Savitreella phatthalungensis]